MNQVRMADSDREYCSIIFACIWLAMFSIIIGLMPSEKIA